LHIFDSLGNHAYWQSLQGVPGGELDRDDRDGYGPEIYRQYSNQAMYYDVYIHYYRDYGNGPTTAYVDVFDEAERRIITNSKALVNQELWYIGRITVNTGGSVALTGVDSGILAIFSAISKP